MKTLYDTKRVSFLHFQNPFSNVISKMDLINISAVRQKIYNNPFCDVAGNRF